MKFLIVLLLVAGSLLAAERPNILWITSEDNASNWLGCYGNRQAQTPRLDALAADGVLFTHAYSNAAVCAVARSTILNGAFAVTQGTQHMRSRHAIPDIYKSYVSYLREQGYYCTNNDKTDYNFAGNDKAIWDECSNKADYKNRPDGKPFFAIYNLYVSHESSLFPAKISANRKQGVIPKTPRVSPEKVEVPPYLPDLPEIRSDIAIYHDNITALDTQVGKLLDELKSQGLAENTIVFYYSDHGGILPRGKRYLTDTGVRVPLLIHVPEKWASLSPFKPGQKVDENVAFVDLAPTVLSLAGLEKPSQMQGRAFLGAKRVEPKKDNLVFLYADRFDEIYGMRRGITDGRWKYIRCFTPHLPGAPYSYYQFGQDGWQAWRKAWQNHQIDQKFCDLWETPQPVERLFDTESDPWEIHNLAQDPACSERLAIMRKQLQSMMVENVDTGIIPEPMFDEISSGKPIAAWLAEHKQDLPDLVELAFNASASKAENLAVFQARLANQNPLTRYWATEGCLILGKSAEPAASDLIKLLNDSHSAIRVAAAHALHMIGKPEGKPALLAELDRPIDEKSLLNAINALTRIDALDDIPDAWFKRASADGKSGDYVKRLAADLSKARKHR
jgi:arylsulfatase A-like enzyme